jgi:hypothetical protein
VLAAVATSEAFEPIGEPWSMLIVGVLGTDGGGIGNWLRSIETELLA